MSDNVIEYKLRKKYQGTDRGRDLRRSRNSEIVTIYIRPPANADAEWTIFAMLGLQYWSIRGETLADAVRIHRISRRFVKDFDR